MPYAPGVQDISGQLFGAGLQQGIAALAQGLQRNAEERKRKEQEKAAKEAVMQAGKGLFGEAFDLKDAPRESWDQIINISQQAQQQKRQADLDRQDAALKAAHLKGINDAAEQLARDRRAITAAVASPWADQSMSAAALRALQGGATPKIAMDLAQMGEVVAQTKNYEAQAKQRGAPPMPWSPSVVDLGQGVKAMTTSPKSAVPLRDPVPKANTTRPAQIMQLDQFASQAERDGNPALAAALRQQIQTWVSGSNEFTPENIAAAMAGRRPQGTPPVVAPVKPPVVAPDKTNAGDRDPQSPEELKAMVKANPAFLEKAKEIARKKGWN